MIAAVTMSHGGPEAIEIRHDRPRPVAGPGEALVRVSAAGVGNTGLWARRVSYGTTKDLEAVVRWRGVPLDFPLIQGGDIAGVVTAAATRGCERDCGRLVTAGAVAGPVVALDLRRLYLRHRILLGSTMHTPGAFARVVELARSGSIRPNVAATYPLAEIGKAPARFERKDFMGKLVLVPPSDSCDARE
jgi:alcohol dehydrogenase